MRSNLTIDYKWKTLMKDFFTDAWRSIPMEYRVPGIYRWTVKEKNGQISFYIGESSELRKRIRSYMRPGPTQHTSRRINALFSNYSKKGAQVKLEVMEVSSFKVNGKKYDETYLEDSSFRRLIENLILTEHKRANKVVHNL